MSKISPKRTARRGRLFPQYKFPPEEIARRNALRETFYKHCRAVFEQVRPELIDNYYNWFIVIEPDTGDYIIDADEEIAAEKARQKHPNKKLGAFRLNETGACGKI
jgi:hypothetical protein